MKKTNNVFATIATLLVVFLSGCQKDDEPGIRPTVTSTSPVNNATSIATNSNVTATFSVPMNPSSITSAEFTVKQGTTLIAGVVTYTGTTATFNPTNELEANKIYSGTITTGVTNMAGSALLVNHAFSFTTGAAPDTAAPTVSLLDPLDNAASVAINKAVSVTFSEVMDASTISSTTFTLKQGTSVIAGAVTYSEVKATFTPSANLSHSLVYTASISAGVKDISGNVLAATSNWSFTTVVSPDNIAPVVNSTVPLDNATGVDINNSVTLTFNEAMDPLTITASTFTLSQGINSVAGVVTYSGMTATFNPTNSLGVNLLYTAIVTTGVKDVTGNALAANKVWSFNTSSSTLGAVDLGAAGNYLILAKSAISNISTSAYTGNLGLSPAATSYITGLSLTDATGYATSAQVTGKIYAADMADPTPINLTTAVENMITAYNDAAGRPSPDFLELGTGNIGGKTLTPGLYKWTTTVTLPSSVTISGGADDVWIFQISGDLTMAPAVIVTLSGGAQAKNIFWQVAGQATFGTTTQFKGIILSKTAIHFQTGAAFTGRALAQTAVSLDASAVTKPN